MSTTGWIERCDGLGSSWERTLPTGETCWLRHTVSGWVWRVFLGYGTDNYRCVATESMTRLSWDVLRERDWETARAVSRGVRAILRAGFMPCAVCGEKFADGEKVTVDHVQGRRHGGDNWPPNLQPAHERCNTRKGNRDMVAAGLRYKRPKW